MGKNRLTLHWAAILAIVLFAFLAMSSLISIPTPPGKTTIDPDIPPEKAAVVVFNSAVNIKEYNGINIEKEWYPKDKLRKMTATMPAGDTHLLFDLYASFERGNTTYTFRPRDLELKFNFEAEKEYTVSVYASRNEGTLFNPKQKIVLAIWDKIYTDANPGNNEGDHIVKSWELGEF
jgi:hypothetical protein